MSLDSALLFTFLVFGTLLLIAVSRFDPAAALDAEVAVPDRLPMKEVAVIDLFFGLTVTPAA